MRRMPPWRNDFLNWAIILWIVLGTARVALDVRRFGFLALRDYAMVYYAAFFFLAQRYAADARARRFLIACLSGAAVVLLPVYILYQVFPAFFFANLSVRGVPLIFFKDDLAATFVAVGAVLVFHRAEGRHRLWAWPLATLMFLAVLSGYNRASIAGAVAAAVWLALGRRWKFPALQAAAAATALLIAITLTASGRFPDLESRVEGWFERAASVVDISGSRVYGSVHAEDKGDNNLFRRFWWETIIDDTMAKGPILGLGFGYDIAESFVRKYRPVDEEFYARSPHSIIFSAFGRMGFVGLLSLTAVVAAFAAATWRALRDSRTELAAAGLWPAAWAIFVSACFGVVLEGPMGAVVFWSLLGLANGWPNRSSGESCALSQTLNTIDMDAPLPAHVSELS